MPQRSKVDALMQLHKCSRSKANNMLRKKGNGVKEKDGTRKTKRRSIPV